MYNLLAHRFGVKTAALTFAVVYALLTLFVFLFAMPLAFRSTFGMISYLITLAALLMYCYHYVKILDDK